MIHNSVYFLNWKKKKKVMSLKKIKKIINL